MTDALHMVELADGETIVRVGIPATVAGVIVKDGRVRHVPPHLRKVLGWTVENAKAWCDRNGMTWGDSSTPTGRPAGPSP